MGNNSCCFRKDEKSQEKHQYHSPIPSKTPSQQNFKGFYEEEVNYNEQQTIQQNTQSQFAAPQFLSHSQQLNLQKLQKQHLEKIQYQEQRKKNMCWEINPQERLLIATSYLIQGTCDGLKPLKPTMEKLRNMIETKQEYCFFNPEKLSQNYNLIEMQGPLPFEDEEYDQNQIENQNDSLQNNQQQSFSSMFWSQMEYFFDDEILMEDDEFQIVAILHLYDNQKYPLAIQKKYNSDLESHVYIVHDIEKQKPPKENGSQSDNNSDYTSRYQEQVMGGYNCKEIVFVNQEKFNNYLDLYGDYFKVLQQQQQQIEKNLKTDKFNNKINNNNNCNSNFNLNNNNKNSKIGIQLVNFQYIYNKSSSNYSMQEENINISIESLDEEIINNNQKQQDAINTSGGEYNDRPTLSTNNPAWM